MEIYLYTRAKAGAKFHLMDAKSKAEIIPAVEFKHTGGDTEHDMPTHLVLTEEKLQGPLSLKIKADSHAGRFHTINFLVVYTVFRK